jgi:hypothetical protein
MVLLARGAPAQRSLLTTQLYFPESVTDAVYALQPYAARGPRSTTNARDGVGVPGALVAAIEETEGGYAASLQMVAPSFPA